MENIKVSIIIPIYNVEKYLRQCLDSAIEQTLKEIEIICVNDGSTDSSLQILEEYAVRDKRIKIINKKNTGYGHSMNIGIQAARGEYIGILESDDFCMPDMYEILYKEIKKYNADVVKSDFFEYTTKEDKINLVVQQMTCDYSYYNRLICPNKERMVYSFEMYNWTGLYKKSFLQEKNIKHNETPGASYQDSGFYFQVFSQTDKLVYIPKALYCYRKDRPEASTNDKKVYTMANEYKFIREFISKHKEFEDDILPMYYARLFKVHAWTHKKIDKKWSKKYAELIRKDMMEAKNLIDINLLNEKEKIKLKLILKSTKKFMRVSRKASIKSVFFMVVGILQEGGYSTFKKIIKEKIRS